MNVTGAEDNMRLKFDEAALKKILMNEKVRDKPVAVISINGKFREGKSFLLCLLLRYLVRREIIWNSPEADAKVSQELFYQI